MKPRLLFLNRSYWPDTEATGQLLTALCEDLTDQFDVHVLAGQPNAASTKAGWEEIRERNGVTIHRVKHTTFSKKNMVQKGINFLSFVRACSRQIPLLPQPDVIVFETDPFLLPFVAERFRRHSGCGMVAYLQDIYPDVAVALEKVSDSWLIRKLRAALFDVYRRCGKIIVLSRDMKQLLLDSAIPEEKISIIPNWADTRQIQPVESDNRFLQRFGLENKFVVMYSGNLGLTQCLDEFVEAAALLRSDSEIQFVFVGQGARKNNLQQRARSLGLSNILFCDYQPLSELSHSLSAASLHLVPLSADVSRCLMPSKLYGILAAGRPILTNAPASSELFEITKTHRIGITVDAGSSSVIAEAIRTAKNNGAALREMGCRARSLAVERYSQTSSVSAFARSLREVIHESSRQVVPVTRISKIRHSIMQSFAGHAGFRRRLPAAFGRRSFYVAPDSQLACAKRGFPEFKSLIKIAADCVQDGDCVWEIGSTGGLFSFLASHQAGSGGTVLCVEPNPVLASLLQRSAQHIDNRDRMIHVLCAAMSARTEIARLSNAEIGRRFSSSYSADYPSSEVSDGHRFYIPATTLDSLLSVFRPPTFIRIDVCGLEQMILEGGHRLLKKYRPRISVEMAEKQSPAVTSFLKSHGYRLFDGDLPVAGQQPYERCAFHTLAIPLSQPNRELPAAA